MTGGAAGRFAVVAGCLAALAGCGGRQVPVSEAPPPAAVAGAEVAGGGEEADARPEAEAPPAAGQDARVEDGNLAALEGMTSPMITEALGQPNFRRRDHSAEVWQYLGDGCILDLFLYREGPVQRVAHYQLRSALPGQDVTTSCLAGLTSRGKGDKAG